MTADASGRPFVAGQPDQRALQEIAAPARQQACRFLILHPFADGLETEPARQIDQRVHEGAVVVRLDDVLHEGAVDLDDIDAELAQGLRNEV